GAAGPAGLGIPGAGAGAGAGPFPGLSLPKGGARPPAGGPHDPRVPWPIPAVVVSPRSPSPPSSWCPCPRCPCLSPWHLRVLMVPISPRPFVPMVPLHRSAHIPSVPTLSPRVPAVSPQYPHAVPPCPQAGLARVQREAEEVAELMRQNVARALEREGHLEQLQSRAQDLKRASEAFTRTTRTVTQRQRRRHRRRHLVALGLGLLLLFILGLALALALARSSPGTATSTVPTPAGGTKHPPGTAGTR
ncbi:VAMP5 protein, partial [Leptocoma aspasia]|nr:VAMP5 protein [Leptocoma aspasia]